MDFEINKGIVKRSSEGGELYTHTLKDFNTGVEFPLNANSMAFHGLQEGDLVEFAGRVQGECIYLAIAGVDYRANMN